MPNQTFVVDSYQKLSQNKFQDIAQVNFYGNNGNASTSQLTSYRAFVGWAESSTGAKKYID